MVGDFSHMMIGYADLVAVNVIHEDTTCDNTSQVIISRIICTHAKKKENISLIRFSMKKILIIIDFIHEFVHRDGKIAKHGMGNFVRENYTIENTRKLIDFFRKSGGEIIWVRLWFHENYDNCSRISPRFLWVPNMGILRENTWSTEFLEELDYHPKEKTITKTRISPFYKTELEEYLITIWGKEVYIAWVATDLAVSSIARDLHDRDYSFTVVSDACGAASLEDHTAALIAIEKIGNLKTTAEIIQTNLEITLVHESTKSNF